VKKVHIQKFDEFCVTKPNEYSPFKLDEMFATQHRFYLPQNKVGMELRLNFKRRDDGEIYCFIDYMSRDLP